MKLFAMCALVLLPALSAGSADITELFVSTKGSDQNPGSKTKPFATLERARDAIRALKKSRTLPPGGFTVSVRGGTYGLANSFTLSADDSGGRYLPITYRAYPGEEVRLTGGREIRGFEPVRDPAILDRLDPAARGKVVQTDLKAQGITDFGKLTPRGFGRAITPAHMELFFNDTPMTLARWPNDGWAKIAGVPAGPQGGKFTYEGDRPSRWAKADDVWAHGYWTWDWADSYVKVKAIDTAAKEIVTEEPHGVYGYKAGARYYALNLLEELDQPGEYYVDRSSGILYFWPPESLKGARVCVSILEDPLIVLQDVSYVTLQGLTLECTRGSGIEVRGGSHDLIAGCAVRNVGTHAIRLDFGIENGVLSCDIYNAGDGGVSVTAGDRKTLTPGKCFVRNCDIHRFGRWDPTYRSAVTLTGVGNVAAHNLMHDAPHSAVFFHGNDHVIEFNEIHHVCMDTSDAGGIYAGRDFSWQGNLIRYNYLHHLGTADVRAIYLDDDMSGVRVFGNVLYKAKMGVCIGGGRDNIVENNIFVDCVPSVHVDNRGENWAKPTVDGYMKQQLEAVPYKEMPWRARYPKLLTIYEDEPGKPKYNVIERNISFGGKWLNIYSQNYDRTNSIKDNLIDVDPLFVDQANENFRLRADSPAWKLGFKRIPVERIGLYMDEYRGACGSGNRVPGLRVK